MMKIKKTGYYSWRIGKLSKGCRLCVQGKKLVMFVTGFCSRNCYYCSLSDLKKNKDDVWANERKIEDYKEIVEEAKMNRAEGAGITGGDPFVRFNRTVKIIKLLKRNFGKDFHIHMYAPLKLITREKLKKLEKIGLDEIRVHPNIEDKDLWYKIAWLKNYKFDSGVEIPAIPGKEGKSMDLINFIHGKLDFININELEMSETNINKFLKIGLRCKSTLSYAIKSSEKTALNLLRHIKNNNIKINAHYCTAKLKDKVQLTNRVKLRARSVAKSFDRITHDGTLIRGAVYLRNLKPGFEYRKRLEKISREKRKKVVSELIKVREVIKNNTNIKDVEVDDKKLRLITSAKNISFNKKRIKELGLVPAILEEYPTHDATEVVVDFV